MRENCQMIVFSNKAYNAIIRESFDKHPVETGGILLGHILDNGVWIVMEVLPPGIQCVFERAYFEYDETFVNYLAKSVATQYKLQLELLGLWHRHPGSMDVFSSTDDGTNTTFAIQNPNGVISGLVNIDPRFRLTMYHMENPGNLTQQYSRPRYYRVDVEVGDDIIPEEYFELKYYDGEGSNLNPIFEYPQNKEPRTIIVENSVQSTRDKKSTKEQENDSNEVKNNVSKSKDKNSFTNIYNNLKRHKLACLIFIILFFCSLWSLKTAYDNSILGIKHVISWYKNDNKPIKESNKLNNKNNKQENSTNKESIKNQEKDTFNNKQIVNDQSQKEKKSEVKSNDTKTK